MITGVIIENFKGIRERVEIELRPITLLFGANGAGKSTIVEAVELLEQLLLDRHHRRGKSLTRRVGEAIGRAGDAAYGQKPSPITLGVTIASRESWHDYFGDVTIYETGFDPEDRSFESCSVPDVASCCLGGDDASTLSLEITFGEQVGAYDGALSLVTQITRIVVGVNERELARLERTGDHNGSTEKILWRVDSDHPALDPSIRQPGPQVFHIWSRQILPTNDEPAILAAFTDDMNNGPLAVSLNLAISQTLNEMEAELARFRRIGPLRVLPPRNFQPRPHSTREDWLSGLAAWDELGFVGSDTLDEINWWLGAENLDSGIQIARRVMIPLDEAFSFKEDVEKSPLEFLRLQSSGPRDIRLRPIATKYGGEFHSDALLTPSQVGTGISQLIPVVVASLDRRDLLLAISQPELHLHPRLQVKLADLFIHSSSEEDSGDEPNRVILETHSEHLILRFLRRIRETSKSMPPDGCSLMSDDIVVYHVSGENGVTQVRRIDVDKNGEFVQPWPDDFFEIDFYERFGQ